MAKSGPGRARVAFARIAFKGGQEPLSFVDALQESLKPGTEVQRYGRLWRMARYVRKDDFFLGRIGFEHGGETETWDPETMDFVEATRRDGRSTPFALDARTRRIAFQLRGGLIRVGTFVGAFRGLLNAAAPHYDWQVVGEVLEPWDEWLARVERVVELRVSVKRHNPRYRHEAIGELIDSARAKAFNIGLKSDDPQGLNMEDEFIRQAIEEAEVSGAHSAKAVVQADGRSKVETWSSGRQGAPRQKEVPADPETREASWGTLEAELREGEDE